MSDNILSNLISIIHIMWNLQVNELSRPVCWEFVGYGARVVWGMHRLHSMKHMFSVVKSLICVDSTSQIMEDLKQY